MGVVGRLTLICAVSALLGAAQAFWMKLPWRPDAAAVQARLARKAEVGGEHERIRSTAAITLEEFRALIDGNGVIIDARAREDFEKSHLRIERFPPVMNVEPQLFDQHVNRLMPHQLDTLVIYCNSETCTLSEELYLLLERQGFASIKIFVPGWEGIVKAGLATTSGPDTWTGFPEAGAEQP
jgi:rhodanese-related sulfurtransferase